MARGIIFAKDLVSARKKLRSISDKEGVNWHSPRLASKQVKHIRGWKTWSFIKGKKKVTRKSKSETVAGQEKYHRGGQVKGYTFGEALHSNDWP